MGLIQGTFSPLPTKECPSFSLTLQEFLLSLPDWFRLITSGQVLRGLPALHRSAMLGGENLLDSTPSYPALRIMG